MIEKTVSCNETIKNAKIYLPKEEPEKGLPMLVFLHGAGERGENPEDADKVNVHGVARYLHEGTMELPAIVFCPQCPGAYCWDNIVIELKKAIDAAADEYAVDKKRISVTGLSMGGYGTFAVSIAYPKFFSAAAPVCGGGRSWQAMILKGMPLWAFHGDADPTVPVNNSIEMIDRIREWGGDPKLTIFHGVGHHSWDNAYLDTRVVEWLLEQKNER